MKFSRWRRFQIKYNSINLKQYSEVISVSIFISKTNKLISVQFEYCVSILKVVREINFGSYISNTAPTVGVARTYLHVSSALLIVQICVVKLDYNVVKGTE
jgi:hypothetical protein